MKDKKVEAEGDYRDIKTPGMGAMSNLRDCVCCGAAQEVEVMEREEKDKVIVYEKCSACDKERIIRDIPMDVYEIQHTGRSSY